LAGLLRNGALSGDFIKADGLSLLVNIGQHPFVPVRFFETEAASYLSNIMRNIGHHDHVKLVQSLAAAIQQTLQATTKFWQGPSALDNWIALKDSASAPDPSGELRKLQGLSTTLNLLSDALGGHGFSNSRLSVTLMKALGLSEGSTLVSDLAALQRVAFMGHVRLKESATKGQSPSTATPSTVLGIEDNGTKSAPAESGAKRMATRLHGVSIQVFKSMIKLLYSKRAMDASHKKEAELLAGAISTEIQKHLEIATDVQTATVALGLATIFLFDERAQEGYVNIVLFPKFEKMGGIKTLVSTIERVVDNVEEAVEAADPSDDQETTSPFARANVGLRVALMICSALVSPKSLVENPQILNNPRQGEPDAIEPSDLLVKMRLAFGPIIHRVWTANWITSTPTAVIRLAVRAFLVIMGGNNEEPTEPAPPPALRVIPVPPVVRAPLVAIPERVNMLVDMGFPRGTAEAALVRARNDIAGAAELILTMPHLFDGVANDEPEPEPVAAVEGPEGGENGQAEPAQSNAAPENEEAAAVPAPEAVADPATIAQDMELDSAPASGEQATDTTASGSEQPPADSTTQSSQTTDSTMEVDQTPTVPIRQQLNELRATWKDDIATHAMEILECAEDLAFDLMPSLPKGTEGVSLLFSQTLDLVEKISEEKAKALSARLRLLAIFIRLNDDVQIGDDALSKAAQIVAGLKIDTDPRPRWMTSLLLFVESILSVADNVLDVKLGHDSVDNIMSTVPVQLTAAIEPLVKQTIGMVADSNVAREELLSGLRVLAIVTRRNPDLLSADDIANVLRSFRQPPAKIQGCQPFAAMIVRHTFERSSTLQETVRSQVKHYLTPQRNKVTDVNHFVKQLRHVAARDPQQFIKCVEQECALVDALPPTSVYHIRPRKDVKDVKAEGTMAAEQDQHLTSVMDMLLLEIEQTLHILRLPAEEDEKSKTAAQKSHSYLSLLVSVVTELVGSYLPAKTILLASLKKQAIVEGHKASLSTIVTELICNLDLNTDLSVGEESIDPERARKREISSWWGSCVVALCSDVTASTDLKDVSEELANVRRTVLDTLLKAFKDAPTGNAGVRYGRYWALGELIYHLLAATSTTATSDNDSSKMHLAKLMLEKNYVNQLTAIIGEIDLNYPGVRVVLASLLKALEHL
jgi:E3 ubiquitin-protein ligase HUWE1